MFRLAFLAALLASPGVSVAQDAAAQHGGMHHMPGMSHPGLADSADASGGALTEGGQSAFAALQEVVSYLMADPATDWSRVDIEALRQHLIDMDNVTLLSLIHISEPTRPY